MRGQYAVIKHGCKELLFVICPKCGYYTHIDKGNKNILFEVLNLEHCLKCDNWFRV